MTEKSRKGSGGRNYPATAFLIRHAGSVINNGAQRSVQHEVAAFNAAPTGSAFP